MMRQTEYAVSRQGVDQTFIQAEREKSDLILEANLLKAQGRHQEAAKRFAAAAYIEEQLSETLLQQALKRKYFIHRFSALSCWAQAGNVYQAMMMGEELLASPDLPQPLREDLQTYVQRARAYLERWVVQFAPDLQAVTS